MAHIEAISRPGVVHVIAGIVGDQAIIGGIVNALERKHGAQVIALCGMVVDDIEDHLDASLVQGLHHLLELLHLLPPLASAGVFVMGGKIADGIVTPVVAQAPLHQMGIVNELMQRQQLDGRDAKLGQVVDRGGMRQTGIGAAQFGRNGRMSGRKTLDVDLVNHRFMRRPVEWPVVPPIEIGVGHDGFWHKGRAICIVARASGVMKAIGEHGLVPVNLTFNGFGIGIEQEFGRIAALSQFRRPGAVDAKAVTLSWLYVGEVTVPAEAIHLGKVHARFPTVVVKKHNSTRSALSKRAKSSCLYHRRSHQVYRNALAKFAYVESFTIWDYPIAADFS